MTPDYVDLLVRDLPRGPGWPQDPVSTPHWFQLLAGLAPSLARVHAAGQRWVDALIPSTTMAAELLDRWERVLDLRPEPTDTDPARAATVVAKLQGIVTPPTLPALTALVAALDPSALLLHRVHNTLAIGQHSVATAIHHLGWWATWTCEYGASLVGPTSGEITLTGTSGTGYTAAHIRRSPRNTAIASSPVVTWTGAGGVLALPITGSSDGAAVRVAVWLRAEAGHYPRIAVLGRDGATRELAPGGATICGEWSKVRGEVELGAGATAPALRFEQGAAGPYSWALSWPRCARIDRVLEAKVRALPFQLHTTGEFAPLGEYS